MEIKNIVTKVVYRIEPKPEGGFIARANDPATPPLEAATREELQQKIVAAISSTLATEFPQLKGAVENKHFKYSFHIEPKPGGGFIAQSNDPAQPHLEGATHEEVHNQLADNLAGMLGKLLLPTLSETLGKQTRSGDVNVVVNKKVVFRTKFGSLGSATSQNQALAPTSNVLPAGVMNQSDIDLASGAPIVPTAAGNWRRFWSLLAVVVVVILTYLLLHRS
jgi:hypothetical protein